MNEFDTTLPLDFVSHSVQGAFPEQKGSGNGIHSVLVVIGIVTVVIGVIVIINQNGHTYHLT